MNKIPLIVVAGATASGKSALAIEIARELDGEIISADSMQIYKYMDIGTAKPTQQEMCGVPHHMIDIITPDVNFSVADYCDVAHGVIADIVKRGKLPVMAGGTGLYISSVVNDVAFSDSGGNEELRKQLFAIAENDGKEALHKLLEEIDPVSASKIHQNNVKRVVRAIEIYKTSGISLSEQNAREKTSRYAPVMMQIMWDREVLYDRINKRVDTMMSAGLADEVRRLHAAGYTRDLTSMQGIGYKEMLDCFDGLCSENEAVDRIKQASRNYAKRQNTWFKRDGAIWSLDPEKELLEQVRKIIKGENHLCI